MENSTNDALGFFFCYDEVYNQASTWFKKNEITTPLSSSERQDQLRAYTSEANGLYNSKR